MTLSGARRFASSGHRRPSTALCRTAPMPPSATIGGREARRSANLDTRSSIGAARSESRSSFTAQAAARRCRFPEQLLRGLTAIILRLEPCGAFGRRFLFVERPAFHAAGDGDDLAADVPGQLVGCENE